MVTGFGVKWITKWVLYPIECPHGYDDCLHCGPLEECIEYAELVTVTDDPDDPDDRREIVGEWPFCHLRDS